MNAKETFLKKEIKNNFKDYNLICLQSIVNSLSVQEIDPLIKDQVFKIFFKKCAKELKEKLFVEFIFEDSLIEIFESSEGGWYITLFPSDAQKDSDGDFNSDDEIDGGLCTGSALNAVMFFIEE